MYKIKCDGYFLHNPDIDINVVNGQCKMEINKTGSLTFYMPPNHPYIKKINKLKSEIILYNSDKPIFYGRVLNMSTDIDGMIYVECEGELSYLLDSIQRGTTRIITGSNSVQMLFSDALAEHYRLVKDNPEKVFNVGKVTVTDSNDYIRSVANYENTLDFINEKIIKRFGGYLKITRDEDGKKRLNYLSIPETNLSQTIELGKNIIELEKSVKGETVYTALIPLGAKIEPEEGSQSSEEKRVTIGELPDSTDGTIVKHLNYIYDTAAVEKYGWIFNTEKWDDVTLAENLLKKAKVKLKQNVNESSIVELTAIDLSVTSSKIEAFEVGEKVHCISKFHDIDEWMIIKTIELDIDNPANNKIKLVESIDVEYNDESLTEQRNDDKKENDEKNKTVEDDVPTDEDLYNQMSNLKEWCNDTFYPKNGSGGIDLSAYAKIADVNAAFSQLATELEGV